MAVSSLAVAAELVAVSMQGVEDGTEEKEERGVAVIHSWSSAMSMETYSTQRVVIPWGCSPNRLPCILQYLSPKRPPRRLPIRMSRVRRAPTPCRLNTWGLKTR